MIDIKTEIQNILTELLECDVTYSQILTTPTYPCVTWWEENNEEHNLYWDEITLELNVWAETFYECEEIASLICTKFKECNMRRVSRVPLHEDEIKRLNIRFRFKVDETNRWTY